jgi:RNA polymerase subunit RPABC4/transcription elongation factor Spt4
MFEETQRFLRSLEGGGEVSIPIEDDEEGYFDRECPSDECLFQFKMLSEDWQTAKDAERMHCPSCGHTDHSERWWTQQQIEHMQAAAVAQIQGALNQSLKSDAKRFNQSRPRGGFISMTMNVDSRPQHVMLPPAATDPMALKITCPSCACRYAVIGAAYFCPACGHSAAEQVFEQTIVGIKATLGALDQVRAAMPDRDTAETTVRIVIENGLQNAVTAFQRVVEAMFAELPAPPKARRNAFQNLTEGSTLWQKATGQGYHAHLDDPDLDRLGRAFQQRHLLAHRQGLVDEEYVTKSGDTRYRPGQRFVLRAEAVTEAVDLVEKLVTGLRSDAAARSGKSSSP